MLLSGEGELHAWDRPLEAPRRVRLWHLFPILAPKAGDVNQCRKHLWALSLALFFDLFRASPTACGSSQARVQSELQLPAYTTATATQI